MGKIIINYEKHSKSFWQKYWGIILFPLFPFWLIARDDGFAGYLDIDGVAYKLKYKKKQHPQIIDLPVGEHQIIYRKKSKFMLGLFSLMSSSQPAWARTLDNMGAYDDFKLDYIVLDFGPQTKLTLSATGGILKGCVVTDLVGLPEKEAEPEQKNVAPVPQKKSYLPVIAIIIIIVLLMLGCAGFFLTQSKSPVMADPSDAPTTALQTEATTSVEESDTVLQREAKDMYVIAEGGLRLRGEPNTDSDVIILIPTNSLLQVHSIENGWAYVTYNSETGWCSAGYLFDSPETTAVNETDIVNNGIAAANTVIRNYASVTANGAFTKDPLTNDEVLDFFHRAYSFYVSRTFSDVSSSFGKVEGSKSYFQQVDDPYNPNYTKEWYQGTSNQYPTLESLCDEYYSYFSNDLAYSYLENQVALIDNKMYFSHSGDKGDEGVKCEFLYEVEDISRGYNVVVTANYYRDYENPDVITSTEVFYFPLLNEDGAWVFTNIQWIPT